MTSDLSARLDLRRRSRRRVWAKRAAVIVLVLAVLVGAVWLVWFSPLLRVRQVEVSGDRITTAEQVLGTAEVPLETPLAALDLAAIRERVLSLPAVSDVKLTRKWPDTLLIELTERQVAYQRLDADLYQWVDASGRIFHTSPTRVPEVIVAQTATGDERLLRDVATMVLALPPEVVAQVDQVSATSVDHLVIQLVDQRIIIWGNAEQSAEKAALLPAMLPMTGSVLDLSVPSHPAIR